MERDFSPLGVKFYYIYKALAHPEMNGYVAPFTLDERLQHVAEAKRKLGSRITWLCDTMANDLKHALGDAPNAEFVVDPEGTIVRVRQWSRPDELRSDLAKLVGPVEHATTIEQIGMRPLAPPKRADTGIVPRLRLPGQMVPVQVQPVLAEQQQAPPEPFYAKLRAEIEPSYFRSGTGRLYLGFLLDPLYDVHWNNETPPLRFEIEANGGPRFTPTSGSGPQVERPADGDPREFLIDVEGGTDTPVQITVRYFVCDDAETFCKSITQRYEIRLRRDRDGGARRTGNAARPKAPPPSRTAADPESNRRSTRLRQAVALFRQYDADADGALSPAEWAGMDESPAAADTDRDQRITLQELLDWRKRK